MQQSPTLGKVVGGWGWGEGEGGGGVGGGWGGGGMGERQGETNSALRSRSWPAGLGFLNGRLRAGSHGAQPAVSAHAGQGAVHAATAGVQPQLAGRLAGSGLGRLARPMARVRRNIRLCIGGLHDPMARMSRNIRLCMPKAHSCSGPSRKLPWTPGTARRQCMFVACSGRPQHPQPATIITHRPLTGACLPQNGRLVGGMLPSVKIQGRRQQRPRLNPCRRAGRDAEEQRRGVMPRCQQPCRGSRLAAAARAVGKVRSWAAARLCPVPPSLARQLAVRLRQPHARVEARGLLASGKQMPLTCHCCHLAHQVVAAAQQRN